MQAIPLETSQSVDSALTGAAKPPTHPTNHTSRHKAQSFSHSCPHLCPRRAAVADETGCGQGRLAGDVQNLQALLKIAFPIIYGRLFAYGLSRVRPPSPLPPAPFGLASSRAWRYGTPALRAPPAAPEGHRQVATKEL